MTTTAMPALGYVDVPLNSLQLRYLHANISLAQLAATEDGELLAPALREARRDVEQTLERAIEADNAGINTTHTLEISHVALRALAALEDESDTAFTRELRDMLRVLAERELVEVRMSPEQFNHAIDAIARIDKLEMPHETRNCIIMTRMQVEYFYMTMKGDIQSDDEFDAFDIFRDVLEFGEPV